MSAMGTRLDARDGVESGAILRDRLGALGPAAREPRAPARCHIGPSVDSCYPDRGGMKRPSGTRPIRRFGSQMPWVDTNPTGDW